MNVEELRQHLALTDERLKEVLSQRPYQDGDRDLVTEVASHLCLTSQARRFRPMLVAVCGQRVNLEADLIVSVSIAAEMIHAASLLHDDVVDGGTERRGQPTANVVWNNSAAVLTGDWLLTQAIQQLDALPIDVTRKALRVISEMSTAALIEVQSRGNILPLERWKSMAEGKTGSLFGWCAGAPMLLSSHSHWERVLDRFGRTLGLAFQLADDIRDFTATHSGKTRWADLSSKNPSSVITLAAMKSPSLGRDLEAAWRRSTTIQTEQWAQAVTQTGAVDEAKAWLQREVDSALSQLPDIAWKNDMSHFFQTLLATLEPSR